MRREEDFPEGHPKRFGYDPKSPEAIEWARKNVTLKGERDWPVDHPAASDTKGNLHSPEWRAGIDPTHTEMEEFTGRTPQQAAAVHEYDAAQSKLAKESPVVQPAIAPAPPAKA